MRFLLNARDSDLLSARAAARGDADTASARRGSAAAEVEVIGAGFGRTGTASLYAALNTLGYKTHHMAEVVTRPGQAAVWLRAARDRAAGRPIDWRQVLGEGGYTAAVDWPSLAFYRELLAANPRAMVVLTLRDFDKWYDSACGTIFAIRDAMRSIRPPPYLAPLFRQQAEMRDMVEEVVWQGTFSGRFADREHARKVYESHLAEVRRVVPPGRLLEFRVQDGWAPLCAFLAKPVPERPFPHVNDAADFRRRIDHMRAVSRRLAALFAISNALVVAALAATLLMLVRVAVARGWLCG
ncbi:hypothetical protein PLESTB_001104200 [Pleodorina starrii]|uniref:Sulfotransferase family protein n=1 Tax=Pleodorina starrii TaxID=330485 RepID=A0A9W6BQK2_9CHLO|nr:hypothetical protein PLESTB_001104200 [Pleodorina starrii]